MKRNDALAKTFSVRLRGLMLLRGMGTNQLAEKTGITPKTISVWRGAKNTPHRSSIKLVADALEVAPEFLTGEQDYCTL